MSIRWRRVQCDPLGWNYCGSQHPQGVGFYVLTKAVWASLTNHIGIARPLPPTLNPQENELPRIADQPLLTQAHELFDALQAETRRRI